MLNCYINIELELKLRLIDYQENLIRSCGKDEEFVVPLSADQLIEVYIITRCFTLLLV